MCNFCQLIQVNPIIEIASDFGLILVGPFLKKTAQFIVFDSWNEDQSVTLNFELSYNERTLTPHIVLTDICEEY